MTERAPGEKPDPYEPLVQQLLDTDLGTSERTLQAPSTVLRPYERGGPARASLTRGGAEGLPPTIRIVGVTRTKAELVLVLDPPVQGAIRTGIEIPRPGIPPMFGDQRLVTAMHELVRRGGHVAVKIDPDTSLSPRCWEAAVYALDPQLLLSRLDCYRVLPGGSFAGSAPPRPSQIVASGTLEGLLRGAWGMRRGVVHVVRRFGRALHGQIEITQDYRRHQSDKPATRDELQLEGAKLLVLQCDPIDTGPQITADLAEPELAREFAVTAIRRTGAAALILPPMPVDLVGQLAGILAQEAGELSPRELVSAARAVRMHLARRHQARLAQEVTLFLRADLSR